MNLILAVILTKIKSIWQGKGRLLAEYLMIAFVVIFGTLSLNMFMQVKNAKKEITQLHNKVGVQTVQLTRLEAVTASQQATISELRNMRKRDAVAIDGLVGDFKYLAEGNSKVHTRLHYLEKNNEVIRTYLTGDIPGPLKCLLSNTCTAEPSNSTSAK